MADIWGNDDGMGTGQADFMWGDDNLSLGPAGVRPQSLEAGNYGSGQGWLERMNATYGQSAEQLMGAGMVLPKLQEIGRAAGLPANFDWTPYMAEAAARHHQQFGNTYTMTDTSAAGPILDIVTAASQQHPSLQPIIPQIGPGSQFWQQSEAAREAAAQQSKASKRQNNIGLASVLAAPALAAGASSMFGAGAQAGAAGGAMDMGVGGVGEAMGLGAGYTSPAIAGAGGGLLDMNSLALANTGTMTDVSAPMLGELSGGSAAGGAMDMGVGGVGQSMGLGTGYTSPASGNFMTNLLQGIGLMPGEQGGTPTGAYQLPWGNIISSLFGIGAAGQAQNNAQNMMQQVSNTDLWKSQQPKYFDPLYDTVTKSIGGTAYGDAIADATARKTASMGYNMSGNQMHEVAKGLDAGTNTRIQALTPLATGRGESPGAAGLAGTALGAQNAQTANIGGLLEAILKGQQPTLQQQVGGAQPNKNLLQTIGLV